MMPIHTILHPTDFSDQSRYAFQLACTLARAHASRLIVVHVMSQPNFIPGGEMGVAAMPDLAESRRALEEQLRQLRPTDPNLAVDYQIIEGHPSEAILEAARDHKADLIVLGTHGRTGLGRLLMGSVAEQVVRNAPCPVLTVKNPPLEAQPS